MDALPADVAAAGFTPDGLHLLGPGGVALRLPSLAENVAAARTFLARRAATQAQLADRAAAKAAKAPRRAARPKPPAAAPAQLELWEV